MTDLGDIFYYLEIKIDVNVGKIITLRQIAYLKKILKKFEMIDCKPATVLINPGIANFFLLWNTLESSNRPFHLDLILICS